MSDEEILEAVKQGDDARFAELVEKYLRRIYNFTFRYLGNREEAEDVTQEVFVRAWKGAKKFDAARNFRVWLFVIAKNASFDYLRKKKSIPFSDIDVDGEDSFIESIEDLDPFPDEIFARKEIAADVERAVSMLPSVDRSILVLRYIDQMTFEEVSEVLNIPMNTAKSRHRRALGKLRSILSAPNSSVERTTRYG